MEVHLLGLLALAIACDPQFHTATTAAKSIALLWRRKSFVVVYIRGHDLSNDGSWNQISTLRNLQAIRFISRLACSSRRRLADTPKRLPENPQDRPTAQ